MRTVEAHIDAADEVYLTSTGETGRSPIFDRLIKLAKSKGKPISVLGATQKSVVPNLRRVEIHIGKATKQFAKRAIAKARKLGIPVSASCVDHGEGVDIEAIVRDYGVDGVIVRALQNEGASKHTCGKTLVWQHPDSDLGTFPVAAYHELKKAGIGYPTICINHFGEVVEALGGAA